MISKAWYVNCDICGNPAPISTDSKIDAVKLAKIEAGFIHGYNRKSKKNEDICPRCRGIKVIPIQ